MKTLATKITALFLAVVCGAGIASMRRAGAEEAKNSNGIIGDVDLNSKIDIQDATELQIYLAENSELSANQLTIADVNLDGKTNIRDVTCIQRYLSGYTGSEIGKELDENRLPDYCLREIESVKRQISASAGSDDVVFGVFTDLHFAENDTEASYTQKINAVRSMRRLADVSSLDFVIQGGDLLTYNTYDESVKRITEVNEIFAGSKAPLLNSKGDHDSSQSGDKKSEFGLDEPRATVTVTYNDKTKAKFIVGSDAPQSAGTYIQFGTEPTIYLCDTETVSAFDLGLNDFMDLNINKTADTTENNDASSITISGSGFDSEIVLKPNKDGKNAASFVMTSPSG